jgi:hypothetical protein
MKRIYVAGSYSSNTTLGTFDNMRVGMRTGLDVLLAGYAPFVPWFDYHFQLMLIGHEKLTVQNYYDYSLAWLDVSDAMLVLPNSEHSKGTQKEIKRAEELGIPIYYTLDEIKQYVK